MSNTINTREPSEIRQKAAELIENNMEDILSRWEEHVRRDIPAARSQERILLRDHLLPYLATMAKMMKGLSVKSARESSGKLTHFDSSANEIHGRLRATLPGYSVEEVIDEYIALRQTIADFIESHGLLDAEVLEVVCALNE
jgi:hypothetical protein